MNVRQEPPAERLILIRHARTRIDPTRPSYDWRLTEDTYADCLALAEAMKRYDIERIVTSKEFKARETGRVLAAALGIPCVTAPGLHEHERTGVPYMEPEAWQRTLTEFFDNPDRLVFGTETGAEALERFDAALRQVLTDHPGERLAVVSHATVISLFVARYNDLGAQAFWKTLRMPDKIALALPGFALER